MKIFRVLIVTLVLFTVVILSVIIYPTIKNDMYEKKLLESIYDNTENKNITYLNKDSNYYILKTDELVSVLDLEYNKILSLPLDKIKENNLELVYRRGKLYYEERLRENNKITYKYYDAETNKYAFEISLGGF